MRQAGVGLLLVSGVALAGQPPASPAPPANVTRFIVTGRVSDETTGDAVRHAQVAVSSAFGAAETTLSDPEGRFTSEGVAAGHITVTVNKPGFVRRTVAADMRGPSTIHVDIALTRGAAIAGTLTNDRGEPAVDASVVVARLTDEGGAAKSRPIAISQTDDLGAFRVAGLAPGTYVLETKPGITQQLAGNEILFESRGVSFAARTFYYPAATDLRDAQRLVLQAADEKAGLAFVAPDARVPPPPPPPIGLPANRDEQSTATVRGRVFKPNGVPAYGARVGMFSVDLQQPINASVTDRDGSFSLNVSDPGSDTFRVSAILEPFGPRFFRQDTKHRRGETLRLRAGETRQGVDITFVKRCAISGRILDEIGEPVEGAIVQPATLRYVNGRRELVAFPALRRTDDQGRFRLFGLPPGTFAVSATVGQVVSFESATDYPGYGRTYFPGTPTGAEAQFIKLDASEEISDINFSLVRNPSYRVSGVAVTASGTPVTGGISLLPTYRSGAAGAAIGAKVEKDGRFEFSGVTPGDYVIQVVRDHKVVRDDGEFTHQFVTVTNSDISGLTLRTSTGSSINGRLTFAGGKPESPDAGNVELAALPADLDRARRIGGPASRAEIGDDRSFALRGISGPRRLQVLRAPAGWMESAVLVGGIDVTDRVMEFGRDSQSLNDVEVVFTDQITEIGGTVAQKGREPLDPDDLSVVAFSTNRELWYLQSRYVRPLPIRSDASFSIVGLPPGEYFVLAVATPSDTGEWEDPRILEALASHAVRVRLAAGKPQSVTLSVQR